MVITALVVAILVDVVALIYSLFVWVDARGDVKLVRDLKVADARQIVAWGEMRGATVRVAAILALAGVTILAFLIMRESRLMVVDVLAVVALYLLLAAQVVLCYDAWADKRTRGQIMKRVRL